jgi:hypothetical protein
MKRYVTSLFVLSISSMQLFSQTQKCDKVSQVFERVFEIYEKSLQPYLEKFSAMQYKGQVTENSLLIQTRIEIYRQKTKSFKEKTLGQLLKDGCNKTELELLDYTSGLLDLIFRYEFPGLDYQFYEEINTKTAKLLTAK